MASARHGRRSTACALLPSGCWSRSRSSPVTSRPRVWRAVTRSARLCCELPGDGGIIDVVRLRIVGVVAVVAAAAAVAVVAVASTSANGLPAYTNGYAKWPRINKKPFTRCGPPCAHSGVKNVYASKKKVGARYPNGTVIVKSVAQPGDTPALPSQVAVMRKATGRWRYVEYAALRLALHRDRAGPVSARAATCRRARTTTCSRSGSAERARSGRRASLALLRHEERADPTDQADHADDPADEVRP